MAEARAAASAELVRSGAAAAVPLAGAVRAGAALPGARRRSAAAVDAADITSSPLPWDQTSDHLSDSRKLSAAAAAAAAAARNPTAADVLLELELDDSGSLLSGDDGAAQPGKTRGRTAEFKAARSRAKEDSQSELSAASDSERVLGSDPLVASRTTAPALAAAHAAAAAAIADGRRRPSLGASGAAPSALADDVRAAGADAAGRGRRRRRRRTCRRGKIFEETPGLARRAEAAVNAETDEELLGEEYLQVCPAATAIAPPRAPSHHAHPLP